MKMLIWFILIAICSFVLGYIIGEDEYKSVDGEITIYEDGSIYPRFYDYKTLKKRKYTRLKVKKSSEV